MPVAGDHHRYDRNMHPTRRFLSPECSSCNRSKPASNPGQYRPFLIHNDCRRAYAALSHATAIEHFLSSQNVIASAIS